MVGVAFICCTFVAKIKYHLSAESAKMEPVLRSAKVLK